jgi:hypothetical protein
MSVEGSYLAFQLRVMVLPFFRIYKESILSHAPAGFVNLEQRANAVADAEASGGLKTMTIHHVQYPTRCIPANARD